MLLFPIPEFKQTLDERYTYSTGGSNVNEYWNYPHQMGTAVNSSIDESGDIDRKSFGLHTQETCTQYNILKVVSIVIFFKKKSSFLLPSFRAQPFLKRMYNSAKNLAQVRHMFQWSPDAKKADDYERKILNGIMGVQKPESMGEMLYMTPLGHGEMIRFSRERVGSINNSSPNRCLNLPRCSGVYKGIANGGEGYGNTDNSFWCCYGTAVESFGKIGDSIYFEDASGLPVPTLYIAQFFSSALMWANQNLTVTQNAEVVSPWVSR